MKIIDAKMYRRMGKEDDNAYLPVSGVQDWRDEYNVKKLGCAKWEQAELEEDLAFMKKYAREQVAPLLEHNSMLSVEEENIGYFTCTKVENDELPWVKKAAVASSI